MINQTNDVKANRSVVDYEEWYHTERHNTHHHEEYYDARGKIALQKFFLDCDLKARILDFGCGVGQNILYLPNAMGYDISKYSTEFAKKKGINATSDLAVVPNESFDIVFSAHVLEHHPHPKTMLEDIHQKLMPGGKLILVLPHERHGKAEGKLDLNQHLYAWNFQNINNLLITTGFAIKSNRYLRGAGYNRLLPLLKLGGLGLYRTATNLVSRLAGIKELMTIAVKV